MLLLIVQNSCRHLLRTKIRTLCINIGDSFPKEWGEKMLDKFRYLQACMCQQISYVHWMEDIMKC
jgi:hypothetical protein